jgi:hypothetical protein
MAQKPALSFHTWPLRPRPIDKKASTRHFNNEDVGRSFQGIYIISLHSAPWLTPRKVALDAAWASRSPFFLERSPSTSKSPGGAILAGEVSARDAAQTMAAKRIASDRSKSLVTADHGACSDRVGLAAM